MKRKKGLSFAEPKKKLDIPFLKGRLFFVIELFFVVAAAYVFVVAFGTQIVAIGNSMAPQIEDGDVLLCDKFIYILKKPSMDDVIAFYPNGNRKTHLHVKRVIGVPGDEVWITGGVCYVNGEAYNGRYINTTIEDAGLAADPITLGEDQYFVLSDHTSGSEDSRFSSIGFVSLDSIYGKVWMKYSDISSIGLVR